MMDAFANAADADPGALFLNDRKRFRRDSLASVLNFQLHAVFAARQANHGCAAARMAVHVGEGLLDDAKNGHLAVRGQAAQFVGDFDFDLEPAAIGQAAGVVAQGLR